MTDVLADLKKIVDNHKTTEINNLPRQMKQEKSNSFMQPLCILMVGICIILFISKPESFQFKQETQYDQPLVAEEKDPLFTKFD